MKNEKNEKKEKQSPLMGLLSFASQKKSQLTFSVILGIFSVFCGLVPYISIAYLLEKIVSGQVTWSLAILAVSGVFAGFLLKTLFYMASTLCSHKAAFEILRNIRLAIMKKLSAVSMGTVQEYSSGELKQLIIDDVERLEYPLAHALPELTSAVLIPLSVTIYLSVIDFRMALASFISVVIGMFLYSGMMIGRTALMEKYTKANSAMNSAIVEYINGMEVIKAFNQTASSMSRYQQSVLAVKEMSLKWYRHCWPFMSMSQAIMPSTISFVLPIGLLLLSNGAITLSELIVCIILSLGTVGAIQKVMEFSENLAAIGEVQPRIQSLIDLEELTGTGKTEKPQNSSIELKNVSFSYKTTKVIHDLSLVAPEGKVTALVGPSGSGKSTLAKLMARFWDVKSGEVRLGGINVKNIPLPELMEYISYVSQDNFLFNISLKENIRIGNPEATDEEVIQAARLAGCDEFIRSFEKGYDTSAGDAGERLSGGERQRIAIARAIIKNAPIVILDEATAFTDPESEDKLQHSIDMLTKGKTLIIIAHRLSTIMYADNIIVLEKGKISAQGTHENLLEKSNTYRGMWKAHIRTIDWNMSKEEVQYVEGN